MSYQVIARKWRPQGFDQLIGQNHVSQTLLNALKNQRLHHALLFTGPRGTGKTSTARILAKALRCPQAKDYVPCHECQECNDIAVGRSIDVIEIDGASNNGVDAIRELRDSVGYMPSSGKQKLYIIDEVHMLSTAAFNALLKTLEEPPGHVIFVMATTEIHKIPNTILSRCQRFDFRTIPTKLITEHLKNICKAEKVKVDDEALWVIAKQGQGSMRDSQSLLDQLITYCEKHVDLKTVVDVLGLTDRQILLDSIQAFCQQDTAQILEILNRLATSGNDPKIFAHDLLEEIRHLLMVKLNPQDALQIVDLPESEIKNLTDLSKILSAEDIHLLFDMALKGGNDIPKAQDPKIVLEMLMLRMSQAPRIMNLFELQNSNLPMQSNTAPAPQKKTASKQADKWLDLVNKIKNVNGAMGAKLDNSFLAREEGKNLSIGIPPKMKFLFDQVNSDDFKKKLTNYIGTFWGPGFQIQVQFGQEAQNIETPKAVEAQKKQDADDEIRQQVENHPLVKSTQSVFKSKITSIKERT